jgi:hypothetical protein
MQAELLHAGGRAKTHFPAERLLAGGDARAPRGELRGHAFLDERVVPSRHLWLSGCTS